MDARRQRMDPVRPFPVSQPLESSAISGVLLVVAVDKEGF
jgi:hypothetical protein